MAGNRDVTSKYLREFVVVNVCCGSFKWVDFCIDEGIINMRFAYLLPCDVVPHNGPKPCVFPPKMRGLYSIICSKSDNTLTKNQYIYLVRMMHRFFSELRLQFMLPSIKPT